MTEKDIKNDVLDVLDDYYNIISFFNKGMTLHSDKTAGSFDDDLKKIKELIKLFREANIETK